MTIEDVKGWSEIANHLVSSLFYASGALVAWKTYWLAKERWVVDKSDKQKDVVNAADKKRVDDIVLKIRPSIQKGMSVSEIGKALIKDGLTSVEELVSIYEVELLKNQETPGTISDKLRKLRQQLANQK